MSSEALEITQESVDPAQEKILQLISSQWLARSLYVVAKLEVADLVADGYCSVTQLAEKTQMHPNSLYRVIRALASTGYFTEVAPREFELTPLGTSLRKDVPGTVRSTILALAGQLQWESWGETLHSVRTGETGVKKAFGISLFDYLGENPEEAIWFNETMESSHSTEAPAVARAYDFSEAEKTIVDLGGGSGDLLSTILQAYPQAKGVLLDLAHAAEQANERFESLGLSGRCTFVKGNFFESVPKADVYILSHVIHDWTDEQCITILENCRQANPAAKVLIIEMLIPSGDTFHPGKIIDLQMLALLGGQERTKAEYAALFARAGYTLAQVVSIQSRACVLEVIPDSSGSTTDSYPVAMQTQTGDDS
ncbi:MAG: methyltransferase domain-containing protein [Gammaproteobacteria bacterium]|nr:methyltransferase domain-containing protein [Gammaproteobacteria bacterium]